MSPIPGTFENQSLAHSVDRTRRPSRSWLRHWARNSAALIGGLALSGTAQAQWGSNPFATQSGAPNKPYVMIPLVDGVAVMQMIPGSGVQTDRLNKFGRSISQSAVLTDPLVMDTNGELVGCDLGGNKFALAYNLMNGDTRVAIINFNPYAPSEQQRYVSAPGFPMTIGSPGSGDSNAYLAITPNVTSNGVDGVMLAWQYIYGSGHPQVEVRQQGVRESNAQVVWTAVSNGRLVWGPNAYVPGLDDTPTIISDGAELAITTYRDWNVPGNGGRVHRTTKLDTSGLPLWSLQVPGQVGTSPGECLVVPDGSGGAFYGYANDQGLARTDLMVAQVESLATQPYYTPHSMSFANSTPSSDRMRPLAAVATPGMAMFLAYRDLIAIRAIKFGNGAGLPIQATTFLQGATADNSEKGAGAMGSNDLAFMWTRSTGQVVTKALDYQTGAPVWSPLPPSMQTVELDVNWPVLPTDMNTFQGTMPDQPQVLATECGFTYGWYDEQIPTRPGLYGIFAEVMRDGVVGGTCPPPGVGFCFGDGAGTMCPCGNNSPVGEFVGCIHSLGLGGKLESAGMASIAADTVVLQGLQMPNSSALYYQGTSQVALGLGSTFGDGLRCAGGSVIRLGTKSNVAGASQYPVGTDLPISVKGLNSAGNVRHYQCWYRNAAAFCTSSTFNLSNGLSITWTP
jgi:hypothetical protein